MDGEKFTGRISRLFPGQGYGFIVSDNGTSEFFHSTALVNAYMDDLVVGDRVEFIVMDGDQGRTQAGHVTVISENFELKGVM